MHINLLIKLRWRILIFLTLFIISSAGNCLAQKVSPKDKRLGLEAFEEGDIYKGIDLLSNYCMQKECKPKTLMTLANNCFAVRDYTGAFTFYKKAFEKDEKQVLALYYLGRLYMNFEKYDSAEMSFDKFRKEARRDRDLRDLRRLARKHIEGCQLALNDSSEIKMEVTHLDTSINKPHLEFAPVPITDTSFMYGSVHIDTTTGEFISIRNLYKAKKTGKNKWEKSGLWEPDFPRGNSFTATGSYSNDGKRFYFTKCTKDWKNETTCKIYLSEYNDTSWSEPKEAIGINAPNSTATMPTVTWDEQRKVDIIYFVSDREDGRGGYDIWYTRFDKRDNRFKEPRNAGYHVNSRGNEITPYYDDETRSLYFASDGRPGIGGYDIFRVTGFMRKWTDDATHLSQPINTSYDDYYPSAFANGKEGLFTSNRDEAIDLNNGHCCDDIFYFRRIDCFQFPILGKVYNIPGKDIHEFLSTKFQGDFSALLDTGYVEGVSVELYSKTKDDEFLISSKHTDEQGTYRFILEKDQQYSIRVKNYGYFDKKFEIETTGKKCGDTIYLRETGISRIPELTLRLNIYYDFDKSKIRTSEKTKLDTTLYKVLDKFPNAIIEIGSHTDNKGSDEYNIELSQRRSESVVNYLIKRGVSPDRLIAKGYGESKPLAPNTLPDGSDNPEGRQLNRRTEIRLVGQINPQLNEDDY